VSLSAIKFTRERFRTFEALRQISDMATWHFGNIPEPSRPSITKAKEIALAVGVLHEQGPESIIMAPSVVGGVVMTFIQDKRDISVACMNNGTLFVTLGHCWFGYLRFWEVSWALSEQVIDEIKRFFLKAAAYDQVQEGRTDADGN
jgi:hypothetical protein